jgi:hypothetical protein
MHPRIRKALAVDAVINVDDDERFVDEDTVFGAAIMQRHAVARDTHEFTAALGTVQRK